LIEPYIIQIFACFMWNNSLITNNLNNKQILHFLFADPNILIFLIGGHCRPISKWNPFTVLIRVLYEGCNMQYVLSMSNAVKYFINFKKKGNEKGNDSLDFLWVTITSYFHEIMFTTCVYKKNVCINIYIFIYMYIHMFVLS